MPLAFMPRTCVCFCVHMLYSSCFYALCVRALCFMPYAFIRSCVCVFMLLALRRIAVAPPSRYRPDSQHAVIVFLILYLAKSALKSWHIALPST
jgi:hypothetical protein